jgi:ABC-2 type transport system permease protein
VQVINDAAGTFAVHKAFIMEGRVRLTDFILCSFSKAGFHLVFGAVIVLAILAWSPMAHLGALWTLLLTLPLLMLNMGWIAVCVALIGARFPDTSELIGTVLVLGLLLTPILWPIDKFPADSLRGVVVRFNPAFHMIDVVRAPVLGQVPEPTSIWVVCAMVVVGWLFTALLFRRYARFVPLWV